MINRTKVHDFLAMILKFGCNSTTDNETTSSNLKIRFLQFPWCLISMVKFRPKLSFTPLSCTTGRSLSIGSEKNMISPNQLGTSFSQLLYNASPLVAKYFFDDKIPIRTRLRGICCSCWNIVWFWWSFDTVELQIGTCLTSGLDKLLEKSLHYRTTIVFVRCSLYKNMTLTSWR